MKKDPKPKLKDWARRELMLLESIEDNESLQKYKRQLRKELDKS